MNTIKVRVEMQLEAGNAASVSSAITEALASVATQILADAGEHDANMIEVPRGKAAYIYESTLGVEIPNDQ